MTEARFKASLPPVLAAIKVSGDGGTRIQLDAPETYDHEVLKLLLWRGMALDVIVRPSEDENQPDQTKPYL
jgi:hypothetical protein